MGKGQGACGRERQDSNHQRLLHRRQGAVAVRVEHKNGLALGRSGWVGGTHLLEHEHQPRKLLRPGVVRGRQGKVHELQHRRPLRGPLPCSGLLQVSGGSAGNLTQAPHQQGQDILVHLL